MLLDETFNFHGFPLSIERQKITFAFLFVFYFFDFFRNKQTPNPIKLRRSIAPMVAPEMIAMASSARDINKIENKVYNVNIH